LRKHSDKKQTEVAEFLGLSQQAYSKLENGETSFSDEIITKISDFFGISPAEFERMPDSVLYVGNNSYNHSSNIHNIEESFMKSHESLLEQIRNLFEQIIREKDERIKLLEKLAGLDKK
jgi:transcriptional regulator with XRE-family HTH domain